MKEVADTTLRSILEEFRTPKRKYENLLMQFYQLRTALKGACSMLDKTISEEEYKECLTLLESEKDMNDILTKQVEDQQARIEELEKTIKFKNEYIHQLGDISDTCTKSGTGEICNGCRCGKGEQK